MASVWARNKQGTAHLTNDFQLFIFQDSGRYSNVDDCGDGRVSVYLLDLRFFLSYIEKGHFLRQEFPDWNTENRLFAFVMAADGSKINRSGGPDGLVMSGGQGRDQFGGRNDTRG